MTFSYRKFECCVNHFKKLSDDFGDKWCISRIPCNNSNDIILKKTIFKNCFLDGTSHLVCWEYHIIFSSSYSVPVLYFNACFADGKLLSLDQLEKLVQSEFLNTFQENKWSILTQQEHPYLRSPFFMLHPCNTANLLNSIASVSSKINPLISWLSSIGHLIDLQLDSRYGAATYQEPCSTIAENSEVVMAVELNPICNEIYRHNFPKTRLLNKNIVSLSAEDINHLAPNAILMSPPCQPFTRLGKQKDLNDARNDSFLHFMKLLPELNSVLYVLIENVKGFEVSETRQCLVSVLKKYNFTFEEYLLNPRQFGICNSRLRYYLLAKRSSNMETIPECVNVNLNPPENYENIIQKMPFILLPKRVGDILEFSPSSCEWDKCALSSEQIRKYISIIDIVPCDSENSCCFTRGYTRCMEGSGSVLSAKSGKINLIDKLDSNMLSKLRLRFFTPKEVARLMCFPSGFSFPDSITSRQRYKTLGNSVNVFVVSLLISYLMKDEV